MIPQVTFFYSHMYDHFWKDYLELYYQTHHNPRTKQILDTYPSKDDLQKYIRKVERAWDKEGEQILKKISSVTGLKWYSHITVYLVGSCKPFSHPLTMKPEKNMQEFIDILTHELIHHIQSQNHDLFYKGYGPIGKKYSEEKQLTKRHILLYAFHAQLLIDLYGKARFKRNRDRSKKPLYIRAWEIVEAEGYENIIKEFKRVIRK